MKSRGHFKFRLYIAGDASNSAQAFANLTSLCREYLPGRHEIEVVDVLLHPEKALAEGILLTPMLVKCSPGPVRKIVGSLNRRETVLETLGLPAQAR